MAEMLMLLGGDRGDLQATFARAAELIAARIGPVLARSRDHWTEPWGFADDELFLNRALLVSTELAAEDVLHAVLRIEQELGRQRPAGVRYGPRTIDIDLLLAGDAVVQSTDLTLPHPRFHERAFALAPAADLVPDQVHPQMQRTVLDLLNDVLQAA